MNFGDGYVVSLVLLEPNNPELRRWVLHNRMHEAVKGIAALDGLISAEEAGEVGIRFDDKANPDFERKRPMK